MWTTTMKTNVLMGLLCDVLTVLAFGFDQLLHVSHMNVVCFDCKHASVLVPTSNTSWLLLCGQQNPPSYRNYSITVDTCWVIPCLSWLK